MAAGGGADVEATIIVPRMTSKLAEFTITLQFQPSARQTGERGGAGYGVTVAEATDATVGATAAAAGIVVVAALHTPTASFPPEVGDEVRAIDGKAVPTVEAAHAAFENGAACSATLSVQLVRRVAIPAAPTSANNTSVAAAAAAAGGIPSAATDDVPGSLPGSPVRGMFGSFQEGGQPINPTNADETPMKRFYDDERVIIRTRAAHSLVASKATVSIRLTRSGTN